MASKTPGNEIEELAVRFMPGDLIRLSREREFFIAETEATVVGIASLARDNRFDDGEYVCLTVFVRPDHHGKGVGKKLMVKIEKTARSKGASQLRLATSFTALPFYRKLGYSEDHAYPFDPSLGVRWMIKEL